MSRFESLQIAKVCESVDDKSIGCHQSFQKLKTKDPEEAFHLFKKEMLKTRLNQNQLDKS